MFRAIVLSSVLATASMTAQADGFTLHVNAGSGDRIATRHVYNDDGCTGQNVAPALSWQGVPAHAKSLAVTVFDPDAPTGHGWWHWAVLNLPATSHGLPEGGVLPAGARVTRNDFGTVGWGGPCPPAGDKPHHYVFTVYALDVSRIDLPADTSAAKADAALRPHIIGKAQQTFLYGR